MNWVDRVSGAIVIKTKFSKTGLKFCFMNDLADENADHYIFPLEDVKCFVHNFFVTAQLILKTI